ncbi:endonuclease/exonuclease/phosphatase family protein [Pirellulales bacterium]|nr:endonuclease/exonuclease/phosphatase family protein [Pirellulales bacterium]
MQRILSLATLAVLGGMAYLFFSGGALKDLAAGSGSAPDGEATSSPVAFPSLPSAGTTPAQPQPQAVPDRPAPTHNPFANASANVPHPGNGPALRIASYNIEVFGKAKATKRAVMYTLAEIVRQFHIVAIQEIRTQDDYHIPNFVKLVNSTGRKYDHIVGPRIGNTKSTEQYAFLFDTQAVEADFQSVYTIGDPDNLLHREPLVASFRTRGVNPDEAFTFTLVNIHTDPDVAEDELDALAEVYRVVRRSGRNEDDVIILGDLNVDERRLGRLGAIPGVYPLIKGVFTNTRQTKLYDNIVIHQPSTTEYAGRSGVFDVTRTFNLTEEQASSVSDHFPVWAEFSIYERDYSGRIASRRRAAR